MTLRSRRLDLDHVTDGMALAEALLDRHGVTLLPQGTVLNAGVLKSLARRGIDEVVVVGSELSEEELEAERERIAARLGRLFRGCGSSAGSVVLRKAVEAYRLGSHA